MLASLCLHLGSIVQPPALTRGGLGEGLDFQSGIAHHCQTPINVVCLALLWTTFFPTLPLTYGKTHMCEMSNKVSLKGSTVTQQTALSLRIKAFLHGSHFDFAIKKWHWLYSLLDREKFSPMLWFFFPSSQLSSKLNPFSSALHPWLQCLHLLITCLQSVSALGLPGH